MVSSCKGSAQAAGTSIRGAACRHLLEGIGLRPTIFAHTVALTSEHPYFRLPLQFAASLRPRLEAIVGASSLADLLADVDIELTRPGAWGTTFTLIQVIAVVPELAK